MTKWFPKMPLIKDLALEMSGKLFEDNFVLAGNLPVLVGIFAALGWVALQKQLSSI
jgi:hypothetical protein